jgi:hypothetical protein
VAVTAPIDAAGHDPGDEDQAERKPANWWMYIEMCTSRSAPRSCAMCCARLVDRGGIEVTRRLAGIGKREAIALCGEPGCTASLDAVAAAIARRCAAPVAAGSAEASMRAALLRQHYDSLDLDAELQRDPDVLEKLWAIAIEAAR